MKKSLTELDFLFEKIKNFPIEIKKDIIKSINYFCIKKERRYEVFGGPNSDKKFNEEDFWKVVSSQEKRLPLKFIKNNREFLRMDLLAKNPSYSDKEFENILFPITFLNQKNIFQKYNEKLIMLIKNRDLSERYLRSVFSNLEEKKSWVYDFFSSLPFKYTLKRDFFPNFFNELLSKIKYLPFPWLTFLSTEKFSLEILEKIEKSIPKPKEKYLSFLAYNDKIGEDIIERYLDDILYSEESSARLFNFRVPSDEFILRNIEKVRFDYLSENFVFGALEHKEEVNLLIKINKKI